MKSLKIASATLIALLVAAMATAAEDGKAKEKKGPKISSISQMLLRIDRFKSAVAGLDLSDDQKEKLGKIRDDFEGKRKAMYDKIGDLLTEEQKQAAQDAMKNAGQSGKKGPAYYQSLEASLKLTDEQKQKIEPIGKELQSVANDARQQVMAVLTPEQKEKLQQKLGPAKKANKSEPQ